MNTDPITANVDRNGIENITLTESTKCNHVAEFNAEKYDPEKHILDCNGNREYGCKNCGLVLGHIPKINEEGESSEKFGRSPDLSIVMENNIGTSPGPQRNAQVMSALNQDKKSGPTGINFQVSKLNLLQMWKLSSNPTDRTASEILATTVREIEKKRGIKLDPARVDAIARACKNGIKKAELMKRLTRKELKGAIQGIFQKDGLWPP